MTVFVTPMLSHILFHEENTPSRRLSRVLFVTYVKRVDKIKCLILINGLSRGSRKLSLSELRVLEYSIRDNCKDKRSSPLPPCPFNSWNRFQKEEGWGGGSTVQCLSPTCTSGGRSPASGMVDGRMTRARHYPRHFCRLTPRPFGTPRTQRNLFFQSLTERLFYRTDNGRHTKPRVSLDLLAPVTWKRGKV